MYRDMIVLTGWDLHEGICLEILGVNRDIRVLTLYILKFQSLHMYSGYTILIRT